MSFFSGPVDVNCPFPILRARDLASLPTLCPHIRICRRGHLHTAFSFFLCLVSDIFSFLHDECVYLFCCTWQWERSARRTAAYRDLLGVERRYGGTRNGRYAGVRGGGFACIGQNYAFTVSISLSLRSYLIILALMDGVWRALWLFC